MDCLARVDVTVVLPLHPRTRERLARVRPDAAGERRAARSRSPTARCSTLERDAVAIATDSGGVQREAYFWAVPASRCARRPSGSRPSRRAGTRSSAPTPRAFRAAFDARAARRAPPALRRRPRGGAHRRPRRRHLALLHPRGGLRCLTLCRWASSAPAGWAPSTSRTPAHGSVQPRRRRRSGSGARARARCAASPPTSTTTGARCSSEADIDAVSIACPSELHVEVALAALDAGKHVLVEKPIATNLPDALRMRGAAREAGRKLMVGHVERFNPAVAKLRDRARARAASAASSAPRPRASARCRRASRTPASRSTSPRTTSTSMQFLLGRQVEEIYADGGRFLHGTHEDIVTCLLRFGGETARPRPARRQLADPAEAARAHARRRARHAARRLHHADAVEVVRDGRHRVRRSSCCAVERRDAPLLEPSCAEFARSASSTTRPSRCPPTTGARALAAALAIRESPRRTAPVTLLDMPRPRAGRWRWPHDPLRHPRLQRGARTSRA